MTAAWYNETDPYAAQWLRNLIRAGHIADGEVDERSIEDVHPFDIAEFDQCHFFAGIGVWSHALRRAGWPDDRQIWTGSCPCQPFSAAGKGAGFDDKRHLWPAWHHLIRECRPSGVLGEQVASQDSGPWIDLVQDDMEAMDYAFAAIPFPAAGVGAPHLRDRLYFVADAEYRGCQTWQSKWRGPSAALPQSIAHWLANEQGDGRGQERQNFGRIDARDSKKRWTTGLEPSNPLSALANNNNNRRGTQRQLEPGREERHIDPCGATLDRWADPLNGFWRDADWLKCRDGKWRPVEPGTLPVAHGAPARVGRLRAYGNALCAEQATAFIECVMEAWHHMEREEF